jgi:suppressor for copper-sensitivity B
MHAARPLLLALALIAAPQLAPAAASPEVSGHVVTGRLIAPQGGVPARAATLSAGIDLRLEDGWKTYWRSPGEVGLPPALDWSGSANVAEVTLDYPAPERFTAFEIENFGYGGEVVFPLTVALEEPGRATRLDVALTLLVCADICVPETLEMSLDLPAGAGAFDAAAAARLAEWVARVPGDGAAAGIALDRVHLDAAALTLTAVSDAPFARPDVFPERGVAAPASYGRPDLRLSADGRTLWARLPVLAPGEGPLDVTVTDGARAATLRADPGPAPPPPPPAAGGAFWAAIGAALLGGLILNVMPCVLPVLSIKLASALQMRDRGPGRVRLGFLAAAGGVLAFFALLGAVVVGLRAGGVAVGWGMQFQQPAFLALMVGLMVLFAANLFGLFHLALPQGAQTALARAETGPSLRADFATGAFAAVMATPCSAPFLGTAVAYALTSGPAATMAVFLAMGAGLAAPFLLLAARPGWVRALPRPGRWMNAVKLAMGALLLLAAAWLLWVLLGSAGPLVAGAVAAAAAATLLTLWLGRRGWLALPGLAVIVAAALLPAQAPRAAPEAGWEAWSPARLEARGATEIVLVDVTADWCLTCQANKRLVLDDSDVAAALGAAGATPLRADWTRPDPAIAAYLADHGRYGIPFNAVYGPGAPDGIVLPELLTERAVLDALGRAAGRAVASE